MCRVAAILVTLYDVQGRRHLGYILWCAGSPPSWYHCLMCRVAVILVALYDVQGRRHLGYIVWCAGSPPSWLHYMMCRVAAILVILYDVRGRRHLGYIVCCAGSPSSWLDCMMCRVSAILVILYDVQGPRHPGYIVWCATLSPSWLHCLMCRVIAILVIQIKYGLPYCVTCPSMSTDPGSLNPGTRRSRVPGWSVRILGQVTQFWQNILNLYYSTGSWKFFFIPLTGTLCQREAVWIAAESGDLWSWALHTTHYYYNYQYFSIQWH